MPQIDTHAGRTTLHHLGGAEGLPDLLLIHGFGSDRYSWSATAPAFFEKYCVWAVELPGHTGAPIDAGGGDVQAMARAVAETVNGKLKAPFPVVGHSLGGAVAVALANTVSHLVSSLVLIAPACIGPRTNGEFLAGFPKLEGEAEARSLLELLVSRPKLISPQMVQHVLGFLKQPGRREALASIADNLARAPQLGVPVNKKIVVVWGDSDVINPYTAASVGVLAPHVRILEGVGHLPHVEQARKTNVLIAEAISPA